MNTINWNYKYTTASTTGFLVYHQQELKYDGTHLNAVPGPTNSATSVPGDYRGRNARYTAHKNVISVPACLLS